VLSISSAESLQRAAQLMTEHATTHLVVVDREGRPQGILSTLDIASALR
jgi:CBS domain-containing protein